MTNEIINNKSKNLGLSIKKPTVIANEKKLKVDNDLICHKGSNVWGDWIKINFKKIGPEQNQTNVGHSVTDEIINGNSENIGLNVKKEAVSAFMRKSKIVSDLIQKKLCGPILRPSSSITD